MNNSRGKHGLRTWRKESGEKGSVSWKFRDEVQVRHQLFPCCALWRWRLSVHLRDCRRSLTRIHPGPVENHRWRTGKSNSIGQNQQWVCRPSTLRSVIPFRYRCGDGRGSICSSVGSTHPKRFIAHLYRWNGIDTELAASRTSIQFRRRNRSLPAFFAQTPNCSGNFSSWMRKILGSCQIYGTLSHIASRVWFYSSLESHYTRVWRPLEKYSFQRAFDVGWTPLRLTLPFFQEFGLACCGKLD